MRNILSVVAGLRLDGELLGIRLEVESSAGQPEYVDVLCTDLYAAGFYTFSPAETAAVTQDEDGYYRTESERAGLRVGSKDTDEEVAAWALILKRETAFADLRSRTERPEDMSCALFVANRDYKVRVRAEQGGRGVVLWEVYHALGGVYAYDPQPVLPIHEVKAWVHRRCNEQAK